MKLRYVLAVFIAIYLYLQQAFFSEHDLISLFLILITTVIMYSVVLELQVGNKKALRVNSKKGSFIYNVLSNDKTIWTKLMSFVVSFFFAFILVVILKGIVLNHGIISFLVIITLTSLIIFTFLNNESGSETVKANLADDLANHANNFLYLFVVAISLNVILSLLMSAHDLFSFLNSNVNFQNFDQKAASEQVEKTGYNDFTRPIMNLYILLDFFKIAIANQFMASVLNISTEQKVYYFYVFYLFVFILNMFKLFAFSLSFVLLQKGLEKSARKSIPYIQRNTRRVKILIEKVKDSLGVHSKNSKLEKSSQSTENKTKDTNETIN